MRLFISNFPYETTEEDLREFLQPAGDATDIHIVKDKETQQSRGFGFCDMPERDAQNAIERLNGRRINGRTIRIAEAQPRSPRQPREQHFRGRGR